MQLGCETDFVAKTDDFKNLAYDIAMHIAAMNPFTISPDEVSHELLERTRNLEGSTENEGKTTR